MSRRQLVDATYDAAEGLNALKLKHRRITPGKAAALAARISEARLLRAKLDACNHAPDAALKDEIARFGVSADDEKHELFWRRQLFNLKPWGLARAMGRHLTRGSGPGPESRVL
jgi:hypothetical protein